MNNDKPIINLNDIEVTISKEEAHQLLKICDHHIREVLPVLSAMLGVDVDTVEGYRDYIDNNPIIWNT